MSHIQVFVLSGILVLLIILSGFFSMAETSLMAVNRYRMKHKARHKNRSAILILRLLKRPDRLLGMVLIGNCLANIVASALATVMVEHLYGESSVFFSTAILTIIILVFAEVAPKSVAALNPEVVAKWVAMPVQILLTVFYPVVWFINTIANGVLRLFRVKLGARQLDALTREELRSVVYDAASKTSRQYQGMLLGILDLNKVLVEDVMIPSHQIVGINLDQAWPLVQMQLARSQHDWLPVYHDDINKIIGILHIRDLMALYNAGKLLNKELLMHHVKEPYFIPEGTTLHTQLVNFQHERKRIALVVDEYGEILGLVTVEDILEEIVGEFTTSTASAEEIQKQSDGSYLVAGSVNLRDLKRVTHWEWPLRGPRTLNGLIIDYLEAMPQQDTCMVINGHPIEILEVEDNQVKIARVHPILRSHGKHEEDLHD